VVVRVGTAVVAGRAVAVAQLLGEAAPHQGLEALVDGGERNARYLVAYRQEDLFGRGMGFGPGEKPIDGGSLLGEPLTALLEGLPKNLFA